MLTGYYVLINKKFITTENKKLDKGLIANLACNGTWNFGFSSQHQLLIFLVLLNKQNVFKYYGQASPKPAKLLKLLKFSIGKKLSLFFLSRSCKTWVLATQARRENQSSSVFVSKTRNTPGGSDGKNKELEIFQKSNGISRQRSKTNKLLKLRDFFPLIFFSSPSGGKPHGFEATIQSNLWFFFKCINWWLQLLRL